jgi:hypothetical protein
MNDREFFDETDFDGYGERDADTYHALRCIEDALGLLACCGKSAAIGEITELLNRAFMLVDRHYGADEQIYAVQLQFDESYNPGVWDDEDGDDD